MEKTLANQYPHSVEAEVTINASTADVWHVLSDFSAVDTWVPFVQSSHIEGDIERGVGIERRCDLGKSGKISETVTGWDEGKGLAYSVSGFGPMVGLQNSWSIRKIDQSHSLVTVNLKYEVKFGLFGRILNFLILSHVLKNRIKSGAVMLLKKRVETGEVVRPRRAQEGQPQKTPAST